MQCKFLGYNSTLISTLSILWKFSIEFVLQNLADIKFKISQQWHICLMNDLLKYLISRRTKYACSFLLLKIKSTTIVASIHNYGYSLKLSACLFCSQIYKRYRKFKELSISYFCLFDSVMTVYCCVEIRSSSFLSKCP